MCAATRRPDRRSSPAWASCNRDRVDRITREFGVNANIGKPQVAYRETIRKTVEHELRSSKQTGGRASTRTS